MSALIRFSLTDSHSRLLALDFCYSMHAGGEPGHPRLPRARASPHEARNSVPDGSRLSTNCFLRLVILRSVQI